MDTTISPTRRETISIPFRPNGKLPVANQQHAATAFPRDMNVAVDRAVRAGRAAAARDLLNEALVDAPSEQGGLDYEGIVRGALDRVPG